MSIDPMYCGYREHEQTYYADAENVCADRERRAVVREGEAAHRRELAAARALWEDAEIDARLERRAARREDEDREEALL